MLVLDVRISGFFVFAPVTSFCVVPVRSSDCTQDTCRLDVKGDSVSLLQTTLQVRPSLQEPTEKHEQRQSNSTDLQSSIVPGRSLAYRGNSTWSHVKLQEQKVSGQKLRETSLPIVTPRNQKSHAIATLACDDKWLMGALALGASLRKTGSGATLVLMISDKVSSKYDALMKSVFDHVYVMSPVRPHPALVRSGADCVSIQLRIWQLPFDKVLYMDADMIALRKLDFLLETYGELTAAAQWKHPSDPSLYVPAFNGGMFVAEPSLSKFQALQELIAISPQMISEEKATDIVDGLTAAGLAGGMQVFLNKVFPSCQANGQPPLRYDIVGCWSNQWLDWTHNKWDQTLTESEVGWMLAVDSPSQFFSSLHYAGGWEDDAKYTKPWESGCTFIQRTLVYNELNSDPPFRKKLRMMALEVWMRAFQDVKAVDHEDLLHVDCEYKVGSWSIQAG